MNLTIEGTVTLTTKDYHRLLDLAGKGELFNILAAELEETNNKLMSFEHTIKITINTLDTIRRNLERSLYGKSNAYGDIARTIEEMEKRINRSPLRG